jgi:Ca-activated chloride channel family protein
LETAVNEFISNFHFLRPACLLLLLPAAALLFKHWRSLHSGQSWQASISAELLPHMLSGVPSSPQRNPLFFIALAWSIAIIALAGPAWQKVPEPVQRKEDALVVLLDLSLSMLAQDLAPSRLVRSQQKLRDLLQNRTEGTTALVAYAGDAHVVAPLTDDDRTIANLLPALEPLMMPVRGSNPGAAIAAGVSLLRDAGLSRGRLLLVTDGIRESDLDDAQRSLAASAYTLSVLGVGTPQGAPIPAPDGFLKDGAGNIIIPRLDSAPLQLLARRSGGQYSELTLDERDLDRVLEQPLLDEYGEAIAGDLRIQRWEDMGFWLLPLLLPIALLSFRRGWLLGLVLFLPLPQPAMAFEWQELLLNRDQHAAALLEQGDAAAAAQRFTDPDWSAAAHYRAENYEAALEHYSQHDSATAWYNRGNSLARSGKLEEAIAAYDEALQRQPELEDASFNKELIEQLLQQQQQEQQKQDQQQQQQDQQQDQQQGQNGNQDQQQEPQSSTDPQQQSGDEQEQQGEQQEQQSQGQDEQQPEEQQSQASASRDAQEQEREQANEQWLRRIPDDPAGLLRRKFRYESQQRESERSDNNGPAW